MKKYELTYKIPLYMYSEKELDEKGDSLCRNLSELEDPSQLTGIEGLSGQNGEDYIMDPYKCYDTSKTNVYREKGLGDFDSDADFYHNLELRSDGFTGKEVSVEVKYLSGSYYVKCMTELDPDTVITYGIIRPTSTTLERAIFNKIEGCASDGIGENELGTVLYNGIPQTVWMDWENIEKV